MLQADRHLTLWNNSMPHYKIELDVASEISAKRVLQFYIPVDANCRDI